MHFLPVASHPQIRTKKTDIQLKKLIPNTAYTLSVFALHGEAASDPLTDQGVTRTWR